MLVLIPHHGLKQVAHILHDEQPLSSAQSSLSHTPPAHTPVWSLVFLFQVNCSAQWREWIVTAESSR